MIPHLITSSSDPVLELEQRILEAQPAIERWFRLEWMEHTPPFYSSVDLRNAGFKLAPVDTNLFPGGFNNLSPDMMPLAVQAAMAAIEKICPEAKNLLVIPENHTRNTFYLENVATLMRIFRQAGLNVRLGSLDESVTEPLHLKLPSGGELLVEPLVRNKLRLGLKDFDPCTILLNNDLSGGIPPILQGLHEQYLLPPLHAGWAVRRKSNHFHAYDDVAKKFANSSASIRGCSTRISPNAARSISTNATVRTVWPRQWTACWPKCAKNTRSTASRKNPSPSSRPTPAPTAWG